MVERSVAQATPHHQPRLVLPMESRLPRGARGDVLVTLSRGLAGKRRTHVRVAHRLGLYRWGDQNLGSHADSAFTGKLEVVRALVTVTYLDVPVDDTSQLWTLNPTGVPQQAPSKNDPAGVEAIMSSPSPERYGDERIGGQFQILPGGDYIHVEHQSSGRVSVMWTTDGSAARFLSEIVSVLGEVSGDDLARWITVDGEGSRPTLKLVADGVPRSTKVLNAHVLGTTAVWRRPFVKRKNMEPRAEAALVFPPGEQADVQTVAEAMLATGTSGIRKALKIRPALLDEALRLR